MDVSTSIIFCGSATLSGFFFVFILICCCSLDNPNSQNTEDVECLDKCIQIDMPIDQINTPVSKRWPEPANNYFQISQY